MSSVDYFDDSYSEDTRQFLLSLLVTTKKLAYTFTDIQIFTSVLGVALNLVHICILSQKSMRSQSANVLLIGIGIGDVVYLLYYVDGGIWEYLQSGILRECVPPNSLLRAYWSWTLFILKDAFRRASAWLGVFLALVRYLILKYGTSTRIKVLMRVGTSWKLFFSVFFFHLVVTMINQGRFVVMEYPRWVPRESCTMYPPNTTFPWFERVQNPAIDNFFHFHISEKYLLLDGVLKLIPPILYPFLAAGLVVELKKVGDGRKILMKKDEENEMVHVTRLVICMTIAYFLAETPVGVSEFYLSFIYGQGFGLIFLVNNITILCATFLIFNSSFHCVFCFFLSSQYRHTVWSVLCCKVGRDASVRSSQNLSTSSR